MTKPSLMAGETIDDRYVVDRVLGAGAMGEVYVARRIDSGEYLALKIIPGSSRTNNEVQRRFQREAMALSLLNHANIIRVYEFGQTPHGLSYLIMDFVPGFDLMEWLSNPSTTAGADPSPSTRFVDGLLIIQQVADALDHAHGIGIVHRDIKPANVLLRDEDPGQVLVIDFGLVKLVTDQELTKLTADGQMLGTPLYMSPEQCANRTVGPPADVYGLGALAYHVLSNVPPFNYQNIPELIMAQLFEEPGSIGDRFEAGAFPDALNTTLLQCLNKEPEKRPTAAELRNVVTALLDQMPTRIRASAPRSEARSGGDISDSRYVTGAVWSAEDTLDGFRGGDELASALRNQVTTLVAEIAGELIAIEHQADALSSALAEIRRLEDEIMNVEMEIAVLDDADGAAKKAHYAVRAADTHQALRKAYGVLYCSILEHRYEDGCLIGDLYDELDGLLVEYLERARPAV